MKTKDVVRTGVGWGMAGIACLLLFIMTGCSNSDNNAPPPAPGYVQTSLGGSKNDFFTREGVRSVSVTADGGFILTGSSTSSDGDLTENKGRYDIWVVKLSPDLALEWQRDLGGSKMDDSAAVIPTSDGGYLMAGSTDSSDGDVVGYKGGGDIWLVKLDSVGNIVWSKCFGGSHWDAASAVLETADGYVVAGYSNSEDGDKLQGYGYIDAWIFKITAAGALVWQMSIPANGQNYLRALKQTADGGFVVVGHTTSTIGPAKTNAGTVDVLAAKLDSEGKLQWARAFGTGQVERGTAIEEAENGDLVMAGWQSTPTNDLDCLVLRADSTGNLLWSRTYGGTDSDSAFGLLLQNDNIYFSGESYSNDGDFPGSKGESDIVLARLSGDGALQKVVRLGGSKQESSGAVIRTGASDTGAFLVAGWTASQDGDVKANHGEKDIWLVKVGGNLDQ